jgi:pimeloyl-ACP methyl ester carboxylesterase
MNILLLHGALGSKSQLAPLTAVLAEHAVKTIDLSGHGAKAIPQGGLTFEHFLQDIDAAMAEANWKDTHLFGYSMGGYAALLYASSFPEKVRSVVTLGTKLKWDREGLDGELRMLDPRKMQEKVPQFVTQLAGEHGADRWEPLVKETACLITGLHEQPLLTPGAFASITCPVLLCVGDQDRTAVPEHTLETARLIPKAGTLVLPFTPHPLQAVDPEVLLPHLRSFWGQEVEEDQP